MKTTNEKNKKNTLCTLPTDWEPVMFYVDINHKSKEDDDYMIEMFEKYFEAFSIGREISKEKKVPHYQVLAFQADKSSYTNFIARVKTKYKLKGRAVKGERKQYGKIKNILKNLKNALIYTLKEKNYLNKWFDKIYVEELSAESYIKETQKDKLQEVVDAAQVRYNEKLPYELDRYGIVTFIVEEYFKKFDRLIVQRTLYLVLYKAKIMSSQEYAMMIGQRWMKCDGSPHYSEY